MGAVAEQSNLFIYEQKPENGRKRAVEEPKSAHKDNELRSFIRGLQF